MANTKTPWVLKCLLAALVAGGYCCLIYFISSTFWRLSLLVVGAVFLYLIPRNPEFWRRRLIIVLASSAVLSVASPVLKYSLPKNLEAKYGTFVFALPELDPVTLLCITTIVVALAYFDHHEKILLSDSSTRPAQIPPPTSAASAAPAVSTYSETSEARPVIPSADLRRRVKEWLPVGLSMLVCAIALALHYVRQTTELPLDRVTALEKLGAVITPGERHCEVAFKDSSISDLSTIAELLRIERQDFEITLVLSNCHELVELSPLLLVQLAELNIIRCSHVNMLWTRDAERGDAYPLEASLAQLTIHDSDAFASCSGLERFERLDFLAVRRCDGLTHLGINPAVGTTTLSSLAKLDLAGSAVSTLDDWPTFERLDTVWLSDCENLSSLSSLKQQNALKKLDISGCTGLKTLNGLQDVYLDELVLRKMSLHLNVFGLRAAKINNIFVDSTTSDRVRALKIGPPPHLRDASPLW